MPVPGPTHVQIEGQENATNTNGPQRWAIPALGPKERVADSDVCSR